MGRASINDVKQLGPIVFDLLVPIRHKKLDPQKVWRHKNRIPSKTLKMWIILFTWQNKMSKWTFIYWYNKWIWPMVDNTNYRLFNLRRALWCDGILLLPLLSLSHHVANVSPLLPAVRDVIYRRSYIVSADNVCN